MPRSFEVLAESPASVEQIHAAFSCEDYWLARAAAGAAPTTLDSLIIDADGTVTVCVTQHVGGELLPGPISKVVPGHVRMLHSETWRPSGDRQIHGQIRVSASGGLGSGRAENWLTPAGNGSQLRSTVLMEVKIPFVGGRLEKTIGTGLAEGIPAVLEFTTTWIAENA